jgi:hypothetical protein
MEKKPSIASDLPKKSNVQELNININVKDNILCKLKDNLVLAQNRMN